MAARRLPLRRYRLGGMSAGAQVTQHGKITDYDVWESRALSVVCITSLNYTDVLLDKK